MRYLLNSVYAVCILIALGTAAVWFGVQIPGLQAYDIKIVQSGSMEPAISTGSVVLIQARDQYAEGDVVTFASSQTDSIPTTHRIIEQYQERGSTWFVTQGDANEAVDAQPVSEGMIIGRVVASVPFIGYVFDFARQPMGFALLIVLPALLIIYGELEIIWRELRRRRTVSSTPTTKTAQTQQSQPRVSEEPVRMMDINRPIRYRYHAGHTLDIRALLRERQTASQLAIPASASAQFLTMGMLLVGGMMLLSGFASVTMSYFSDSTVATGTFQAGQFAPEPPPEVTLTVNPETICMNYTPRLTASELDLTADFAVDASGGVYSVEFVDVDGDNQLCGALRVSHGGSSPVFMENFTATSTSDTFSLTFSNASTINPGNRTCTMIVVFTTAIDSEEVVAQSSITIGDSQQNQCPATGGSGSGAILSAVSNEAEVESTSTEDLAEPEVAIQETGEEDDTTEAEGEITVPEGEQLNTEDALNEIENETEGRGQAVIEPVDTEEVVDGDVVEEDLEEDQSTPEDEVVPE